MSFEELIVDECLLDDRNEILAMWSIISTLESDCTHPIASVLKEEACKQVASRGAVQASTDHSVALDTRSMTIEQGLGVQAEIIRGNLTRHVAIGSLRFMKQIGAVTRETSQMGQSMNKKIVYVSYDYRVVARILLREKLRSDAFSTIQKLRSMGLEIGIVSQEFLARYNGNITLH